MKKKILTTAIAFAIAGSLTACGGGSSSSAGTSTDNGAQAKSASMTVQANLPDSQASASVIQQDTATLKISLYHVADVVAQLNAFAEEQQPVSSDLYYSDLHYLTDESWGDISAYLKKAPSEISQDDVIDGFAEEVKDLMEAAIDQQRYSDNAFSLSANESFELTTADPSHEFQGLKTGPYAVVLEQFDGENTLISSEMMAANLGEGDNNVVANMLNGSWQFVDANNNPTGYDFPLLNSNDTDILPDFDPTTEGHQNFAQTYTNGGTDFQLNAIHYLSFAANPLLDQIKSETYTDDSSGNYYLDGVEYDYDYLPGNDDYYGGYSIPLDADGIPLPKPVQGLFEISAQEDGQPQSTTRPEYREWESATDSYRSEDMELAFNQAYDYRLEQKNVYAPELFQLNMHVEHSDESNGWRNASGGADIFFKYEENYDDYDEQSKDESTYTYMDAEGNEVTFDYVNAYNWKSETIYSDQYPDINNFDNTQLTNGNNIDGYMVEYITGSSLSSGSINGLSEDEVNALRPDATAETAGMALAMASISQRNNPAQAAATHPLSSGQTQCTEVTEQWVHNNATYAYINNEWVAGTINYSYQVMQNSDGTYTTHGRDLNGDGNIDPFETGVVDNDVEHSSNSYFRNSMDESNRYEVAVGMPVGTDEYAEPNYYLMSDVESWTQKVDDSGNPILEFEQPIFIDNEGNEIVLETNWEFDATSTEGVLDAVRHYAFDLDGDGQAEPYESVKGENYTGSEKIIGCLTPITLVGSDYTNEINRESFRINYKVTGTITGTAID